MVNISDRSIITDSFETVLGTPTAQKIIKILVTYFSLSAQDLAIKSHVSKSQVHTTLKKLIAHNILESPSRGMYTLQKTPFTKLLKEAYHMKILELINVEIYNIHRLLKSSLIDEANNKLSDLLEQYKPILEESFTHQLNSLAHEFIDRVEDAR